MIFCTSICANYIPKAKVLASSLKKHNPAAVFVICLVERQIHDAANDFENFDLIIKADELEIVDFEGFIFKHSIVEASTAVKAHLLNELIKRFPEENKFVYLDPDILVMGPFIELSEVLENNNIVLTPHLCEPEEELDAVLDNEVCALKHGVFNLGFLAVRRSPEAQKLLDWWAKRLYAFCYADISEGLFTDQKWMDLAPCFFNVYVFRHPGYNIAPWNLSRRRITLKEKEDYYTGNYPLRFFHFSGFDSGANEAMVNKYCPDRNDIVYRIRSNYIDFCKKFGQETLGKLPWSYNFYKNGEKILSDHRRIYRSSKELQNQFKRPFDDASHFMSIKINDPNKCNFTNSTKLNTLYMHTKLAYRDGGIVLVFQKVLKYFIGKVR